ncbi:transmembrane protein, putative (macronuclear) [Tetrahymena thermophila SB210]|uniref:Transmembrane protein, putative n=1 Tax=Tetrahymena thermophila (strain SB210) TaxID=312017 RepID=Q245H3_TETTS|nr:transmembrane protein, putative [Tetrahymena thermophila SB210]EAS03391.2 transmembrane protein, putative [Tetrahymena thermophila SB210]|eukprot:XP_001023636.2 transmembrane protein, putative [Tetrahymena thermophila SB210]
MKIAVKNGAKQRKTICKGFIIYLYQYLQYKILQASILQTLIVNYQQEILQLQKFLNSQNKNIITLQTITGFKLHHKKQTKARVSLFSINQYGTMIFQHLCALKQQIKVTIYFQYNIINIQILYYPINLGQAQTSIACTNLYLNKYLSQIQNGSKDTYLSKVYSYLIYPNTRQVIAVTGYQENNLETVDSFEFGSNYLDSNEYQNFYDQTSFITTNSKYIYKNNDYCTYKQREEPKTIEFIDENNDAHILVISSIFLCEKNYQNKYNLIRVSYIGTAINKSLLNDFVLEKTTNMSINQEISLLISIILLFGTVLFIFFIGFYITQQILEPIENFTKGLKILDAESIKILYKKVQNQHEENLKAEVYEPLTAYHNLISLISEGNQLYSEGKTEEAFELFKKSQQIYNYLGNYEGCSICLHNQGVIMINQNKLPEGMQLIKQSLDLCWEERFQFQQKYLSQGISEEEILTDERYYHILITICRRTFTLIEANLILIRQFQMGNRLQKVNAQTIIELINDIIDIQNVLCKFGKVTSILIYAKIQLSYFYYLQDDLDKSQSICNFAEEAYDGYFPKLSYNLVNSFPLCVLHQALLVQKGLIQEKLGNLYQAAQLFTISIEEVEEYKPDLKQEALLGLQRILSKIDLQNPYINYFLSAFQESVKEVYFLIDLSLGYFNQVIQMRERIIKLLCDPEDRISQISLSTKLQINFLKISTSDDYIRQRSIEPFDFNVSYFQEGLKSIYQKIQQSTEYINQVPNNDFETFYRGKSINFLKHPNLNMKQIMIIFTDLSKFILNEINDQDLKDLSENFTIILIDVSHDYVNTDQMFNKIVLSENLNYYHYFSFNSINNTLIEQWRYLTQEQNTNFKFSMEFFQ